jgi:hypothetical protein
MKTRPRPNPSSATWNGCATSIARAARSTRSSRNCAAAICTEFGIPSPRGPIGTEIAGWRVRLNVNVHGAQAVHSARTGSTVGASASGGPPGTVGHNTRS